MDVWLHHLPLRQEPLVLLWPMPRQPVAVLRFITADEWRAFVEKLALDARIPDMVRLKFGRAHKLFLLGWIDVDLIKGAELVALTALELALRDRFGPVVTTAKSQKAGRIPPSPVVNERVRYPFAELLRQLVKKQGLTDAEIPQIARCGGTAIGRLSGRTKPTLAEIRNNMAHGDPFDGMPTPGLIELVRDLINFAYREYLAEASKQGRL